MHHTNDICAIDTDGIKVTSKLADSYIGPELGLMKYEGMFKEAVFIAPKVYGGIEENDNMLVKVKGLKEVITYWSLKTLLHEPNLKVSQTKWYRNLSDASIYVMDQIYTLTATSNKRVIIRDSCGKYIDNIPHKLIDGLLVTPPKIIIYYISAPISYPQLTAPIAYPQLTAPISYPQLPAPIIYLQLPSPITRHAFPTQINYPALPWPTCYKIIYLPTQTPDSN